MTGLERLDLAYFVYGTLRPGHGNSLIWQQLDGAAAHDGDAYVEGFQMFGSIVPYAVHTGDPADRVYGAVITPPGGWEAQLLLRHHLDSLEGYPRGYDRLIVPVRTPDGPAECWIYTPTAWKPGGEPEPSGDYNQMLLRGYWGRSTSHA